MKKLRRILAIALTAVLLFGGFPAAPAEAALTDISGHWAETGSGALSRWEDYGVTTSYDGKFYPNAQLTRYEAAVMLDRLFKFRLAVPSSTFSDVDPDDWFAEAIYRVNKAGLMLGDAGRFDPNGFITREQMAVILCKALHLTELSGETRFVDNSRFPSWSKPYIRRMQENGIIAGIYRNGSYYFDNTDNIDRASFISLLDRSIDLVANTSMNYSGDRSGMVVINSSGAGLSGMRVQGDVIVSEGVADGSADIRGATITGTLYLQGGRKTVNIYDSYIANIVVDRAEGEVQVKIGGNSSVDNIKVKTPLIITELSNLVGAGFKRIEIPADAQQYVRADILGDATEIVNYGNSADLRITGYTDKLTVNTGCAISGNVKYGSLAANTQFTLNGEVVNASHTTELSELSLSPSSVNVSNTIYAVTSSGESSELRYQWYRSPTNLDVNSGAWIEIYGAWSRAFTPGYEYTNEWLMCQVTGGGSTLRAKTSAAVGSVSGAYANCYVEEYNGASNVRSEIMVRFVYTAPLYNADGRAIADGYDFKTGPAMFSVKVNSNTASVNDSLIASAVYSTTDNSILVTLSGDASMARNRVEIKPNARFYTSSGGVIDPADAPAAIRVAGVSTWQNTSRGLDGTAPTLMVASGGQSGLTLRLQVSEPLGYTVNSIVRPMPNMYSLRDLGGSTGMFSLTIDREPVNDANFIQTAYYSSTEQALIIGLTDIENDSAVTLALLQPLRDIYGNTLLPNNMGVYFRRANDAFWYRAETQDEANASASGQKIDGIATLTGVPLVGNTVTVDTSQLTIQTNLRFDWYRLEPMATASSTATGTAPPPSSPMPSYAQRTLVASNTRSYTITQNEANKFIICYVYTSITPGVYVPTAAEYVGKSKPTVVARDVAKTFANISQYNPLIVNMSELFTISPTPAGKITYKPTYETQSGFTDKEDGTASIANYGTYYIEVIIADGDNNFAYPETGRSVVATLIVNNALTAPRNLTVWASLPTDDKDAWQKTTLRYLTTNTNTNVYYNPIPVNGSPREGEALALYSTKPTAYSQQITDKLGTDVALNGSGYYYVVETEKITDRVITTGVVYVEPRSIYAAVLVENRSSPAITIASYSITSSVLGTGDVSYSGAIIFVPASTGTIYFTANNSKNVLTKRAFALTYTNMQARVTIDTGAFG
ncbi:MAG: S-layer homology domain-containing protein [Oscillospiraceae bacterium]|nr:S-layer homology domain-containing protein [Oscillospiraceae bacterium]